MNTLKNRLTAPLYKNSAGQMDMHLADVLQQQLMTQSAPELIVGLKSAHTGEPLPTVITKFGKCQT